MIIQGRARSLAEQSFFGEGPREFFAPDSTSGLGVVAAHGFTGTVAEILPVLERLAADGHGVDGALLPGHGTAATDLQAATYEDWVADVRRRTRAAIDRYGRVVLLGFSLGSLPAIQIASEAGAPTNGGGGSVGGRGVVGLVVLANALILQPPTSLPLALVDRTGLPMPDAYLVKPRAGDLVDPTHMGRLVTYDRHPLRAALEVYRAGVRLRGAVGRITCPTLALHGRHDHVCPWTNAPWLAARLGTREVTVRLFEKSAHVLAWDGEREEVAGEVSRFVGELAARSPESARAAQGR